MADRPVTALRRAGATRTYIVRVYGYDDARYSAHSPGQARAKAYRNFCEIIAYKTFHEFLIISSVRRVP